MSVIRTSILFAGLLAATPFAKAGILDPHPWDTAANVLFDNGAPSQFSYGGILISDPYVPVDDFILESRSRITEINWNTSEHQGYNPTPIPYISTVINIFKLGASNLPGEVVFHADMTANRNIWKDVSMTEYYYFNNEVGYSVSGLDIVLEPGRYYLGITQDYAGYWDAVWSQSRGFRPVGATTGGYSLSNDTWYYHQDNLAFRLLGDANVAEVPEPSTPLLFTVGALLLGLSSFIRRGA